MRGNRPKPRTAAEFLLRSDSTSDDDDADDEVQDVIEVLAPNWNTVEVFRSCTWLAIATLAGVHYDGITATEIRSALLIHRIPRADWSRITRGIQHVMVPAARKNLNAKKGSSG